MTQSIKMTATQIALAAALGVSAGAAQACVGNSGCTAQSQAGNTVAQAAGGNASVSTPKLGLGVMLGGGSAAAVPDNCTTSYHILFWGQNNSNFGSDAQKACINRQGQLQIGLMAAQSDDPATKASGMSLLGSMYPAYGDINKKLIDKMNVCFNGGKDYIPAVPATPAPAPSTPATPASGATAARAAVYGQPRELSDHWLKINSDNPAIYCGSTIVSKQTLADAALTAQRAHEIGLARAGKPETEITLQAPAPAACPKEAPTQTKGRRAEICVKRSTCGGPCERKEWATFDR